MTTPIEGRTPMPWTVGPISASELTVRFGHAPECADGPDDLPWDCTCNYAERIELYQAAVNDYDRLRAIEDAARAFVPSLELAEGHPAHDSGCTFCTLRDLL